MADNNGIFRSIDEHGRGSLTRAEIIDSLSKSGIAIRDSRLDKLRDRLDAIGESKIDATTFEEILDTGSSLVRRAAKGDLVIPEFDSFAAELNEIYAELESNRSGSIADYIPQLARVPADKFAVAVCTIDGQQASIGDADDGFTLQSSCKPFLYCAALEEHGEERVHSHVGREPSGLSFNELTLNKAGLPHNPMINAGAIMTSSLMRRDLATADRIEYLTGLITSLSGQQPCHVNNAVWHSERETADRNFALAHHMRERGAFPPATEIGPTLDYYFSACSIEVTARSMATIGSTLANAGVCPTTGERVFAEETVKNCLSMMHSCGMYDYSGEFAFTVGLPAKSAVSGVVLAVVPNVMGIVVWSPRLDDCGNSVRGVEFFRKLVDRFSLHNFDSLVESRKRDPRRVRNAAETDHTYKAIFAASNGDLAELKRLVAHGHDLDSADYDGRTPLHLACSEGQEATVAYLLAQGVSPEPLDRWGNSPLADAIREERNHIVHLFESGKAA